jgi:hypothetical protein
MNNKEEEEANKDKNVSRIYNATKQQFTGTCANSFFIVFFIFLFKKNLKMRNSQKQRKIFAGSKLLLPVMRVLDACCMDREIRRLYSGKCCVSYCTAYFTVTHTRRGGGWG